MYVCRIVGNTTRSLFVYPLFLDRVYGIRHLRVVDASVMPRTPNSNTNAPVMLVAEKASQDILAMYASK